MKTILLTLLFFSMFASLSIAADDALPIEFGNDLVPVFTKHGCNAGACHGAAIGRGGFKLSLYGGNPEADYDSIVYQLEGRRIHLANPEQSLIVLKPAEYVAHGGGTVFDFESESAQLLIKWIRQGAGKTSRRNLQSVEVTPQKHVAKSLHEDVALKAIAHYSDGSSRDVTRWTIFSAEDSSAVDVDPKSNQATILRRGRHVLIARYLSEVVPIELIVPLTDSAIDLTNEPRHNFIDEEVLGSLKTLRLPVSPNTDEAAFLRRASLDLTGRLPTVERFNSYLSPKSLDPSSNLKSASVAASIKRRQLIDDLLDSDEFNEYWTLQFARLLRIRQTKNNQQSLTTYHTWLADQIANDVSYKTLAQTLILASGDSTTNGPANFYRTVNKAREQAEFASELFMGSRLRCANCHNHPLDRWTQDDYHGLAAIFARVEAGKVIAVKPGGEVIHPRTLESAKLRIPGEHFLTPDIVDGRQQLADWLTDSDNPYFAKAIVNRLWKRMLGRGLVEPTDDFRATNPATHPQLLDKLAKDFIEHDYSIRHTLRVIANSATYARSSNANSDNKNDDRFYSHAIHRPLEPEVLADAVSDVLGVSEKYGVGSGGQSGEQNGGHPLGTRAVTLIDPATPSISLDILGRCGREESCESTNAVAGGLPQKLHLFNGKFLNARISTAGSRLDTLLKTNKSPIHIIADFYVAALNRRPTEAELDYWKQQLAVVSPQDHSEFLEDFVWGLVTSDEFVTNH